MGKEYLLRLDTSSGFSGLFRLCPGVSAQSEGLSPGARKPTISRVKSGALPRWSCSITACWRGVLGAWLVFWLPDVAAAELWPQQSPRWLGERGAPELAERWETASRTNSERLVLWFGVPGLAASAVGSAGGGFTRLLLPNAGVSQTIGQPELPVYRKLLFFESNARLSCNASVTSGREFVLRKHDLPPRAFPSQRPIPKIPGALEATELGQLAAASEPQADRSAGLHPALGEREVESRLPVSAPSASEEVPVARLVDLGIARGRRVVLLEVFPLSYDAETGSVILRESVEVEILAEGSPDAAKNDPTREPGSRSGVLAERRKLLLPPWRRSAEPPLRQGSEIESANAAAESPPSDGARGKVTVTSLPSRAF